AELRFLGGLCLHRRSKEAREDLSELAQLLVHSPPWSGFDLRLSQPPQLGSDPNPRWRRVKRGGVEWERRAHQPSSDPPDPPPRCPASTAPGPPKVGLAGGWSDGFTWRLGTSRQAGNVAPGAERGAPGPTCGRARGATPGVADRRDRRMP